MRVKQADITINGHVLNEAESEMVAYALMQMAELIVAGVNHLPEQQEILLENLANYITAHIDPPPPAST